MLNAMKHRLAFAFLYPEELIELVDLCTDTFTGLEAHYDDFAVYKTVRNVSFFCAAFSMLPTKPFIAFLSSSPEAPDQ